MTEFVAHKLEVVGPAVTAESAFQFRQNAFGSSGPAGVEGIEIGDQGGIGRIVIAEADHPFEGRVFGKLGEFKFAVNATHGVAPRQGVSPGASLPLCAAALRVVQAEPVTAGTVTAPEAERRFGWISAIGGGVRRNGAGDDLLAPVTDQLHFPGLNCGGRVGRWLGVIHESVRSGIMQSIDIDRCLPVTAFEFSHHYI